METETYVRTIDVNVKNWADAFAKPRTVKHTTLKTWVVDSTGATGAGKQVQIASYEPDRVCMRVYVNDFAVAITSESPNTSPDTSAVGTAPQGAYLPVNVHPYEFYGPDQFWINSVAAGAGRITVIKEYC
jgi:hypothetical protein